MTCRRESIESYMPSVSSQYSPFVGSSMIMPSATSSITLSLTNLLERAQKMPLAELVQPLFRLLQANATLVQQYIFSPGFILDTGSFFSHWRGGNSHRKNAIG